MSKDYGSKLPSPTHNIGYNLCDSSHTIDALMCASDKNAGEG